MNYMASQCVLIIIKLAGGGIFRFLLYLCGVLIKAQLIGLLGGRIFMFSSFSL